MNLMNPLSAPHHYYWESLTGPLPQEGKVLDIIKRVALIALGIFLIPLFGIMKLIGDKLPINAAVVFVNSDMPLEIYSGGFPLAKHIPHRSMKYIIEDY